MKKISCGVIVHDDTRFLAGHVTGQNIDNWSLPKGKMEEGESYLAAALRELYEETSIFIDLSIEPTDDKPILIPLGLYTYTPKKDLYLFSYECDLEALPKLKCTSMVDKPGKEDWPELDWFKFIPFDQADKYMHPVVAQIIKENFIK